MLYYAKSIYFKTTPLVCLLSLVLLTALFSSCGSSKSLYVQDKSVLFSEDERDSVYVNVPKEYKLQPDDYLYVKIFSHEKSVEESLTSQSQKTGGASSQESQKSDYLNGYIINETGHIEIPLIGKILIEGKTEKEAQIILQNKVDDFLIGAKAVLKLLNFKVTFLGEVKSEGVMFFYQRNLNVLEALARVGGVDDYGKIHNVLIIRQKGSKKETIRVDLTDRALLTNPNFYLQPNDIVYIEPNKSKQFRMKLADYALIIGTITSTISTLLLVVSLSK